jgi:hypothetical protein
VIPVHDDRLTVDVEEGLVQAVDALQQGVPSGRVMREF